MRIEMYLRLVFFIDIFLLVVAINNSNCLGLLNLCDCRGASEEEQKRLKVKQLKKTREMVLRAGKNKHVKSFSKWKLYLFLSIFLFKFFMCICKYLSSYLTSLIKFQYQIITFFSIQLFLRFSFLLFKNIFSKNHNSKTTTPIFKNFNFLERVF